MTVNESSSQRSLTLVAVHGVGDSEPGAISRDLCQALQATENPDAIFERADLLIKGTSYPRYRTKKAHLGETVLEDVIEVNWADVLKPTNSAYQVLRHLFHIVIGMRHLSVQPGETGSRSRRPLVAKLYWISIEWLVWWSAYFALSVMLISSCGPDQLRWKLAFAGSAPLGAAVMAWALGRYSKGFQAGWVWAILIAGAGFDLLQADPWLTRDLWIRLTGWTYAAAQVTMGATLIAAYLESWVKFRSQTPKERSARAALTWIPFIVVCAVGAGSWSGTLLFADQALGLSGLKSWQAIFLEALHYDLLWAEVGTLSAVLLTFGLLPSIGSLAYAFEPIRKMLNFGDTAGQAAHQTLAVILRAGPLFLILGGIPFWYTLVVGSTTTGHWTVFETYSLSASRILLILPFLLPVARVILDCAGDVIFHLQPKSSRMSSQQITRRRLKGLLESLRKERPEHTVVVLAHSQGSVITWEAMCEAPELADEILTMGSPLSTLYGEFLGGDFGNALPQKKPRWRNVFRSGDYIGGAVAGCPDNQCLGPGGHTDYWSDPRLVAHLLA